MSLILPWSENITIIGTSDFDPPEAPIRSGGRAITIKETRFHGEGFVSNAFICMDQTFFMVGNP